MANSKVWKTLAVLAKLHSRGEIDSDVVEIYEYDLRGYPDEQLLYALERCRRELNKFPTIADIVYRIDDGRPGADEAWAMIPKTEADSVVWSEEMRDAFAVARPLLAEDPIAARMAFREAYVRILTDARSKRMPAKWIPSLGHDQSLRAKALQVAVQHGRIVHQSAENILPDYSTQPKQLHLEGPEDSHDRFSAISNVIERIMAHAPESRRRIEMARRKLKTAKRFEEPDPKEIENRKKEQIRRLKAGT